jgi:hypothetical protein
MEGLLPGARDLGSPIGGWKPPLVRYHMYEIRT